MFGLSFTVKMEVSHALKDTRSGSTVSPRSPNPLVSRVNFEALQFTQERKALINEQANTFNQVSFRFVASMPWFAGKQTAPASVSILQV
jgi:hypothetical protein